MNANHKPLVATLILAVASAAAAQELAIPGRSGAISRLPQAGARIRLTAPGVAPGRVVGNLIAVDETFMTVLQEGSLSLHIRLDAITSFEVSTSRDRGWKKGGAIGAGFGALLGLGMHKPGEGGCNLDDYLCASDPGSTRASLVVLSALYGAGIGALRKSDHWTAIPVQELHSSIAARSDLVRFGPSAPTPLPAAPTATATPFEPSLPSDRWMGDRIRIVRGSGQKLVGQLASLSTTHVRILTSSGPVVAERSAIIRMETSTERKSQWLRGLLIGAAAGAALDFVDAPYCTTGRQTGATPRACSRAESATETAIGGAGIGALIGHFVKKDVWRPFRGEPAIAGSAEGSPRVAEPMVQMTPLIGLRERKAGVAFRVSW